MLGETDLKKIAFNFFFHFFLLLCESRTTELDVGPMTPRPNFPPLPSNLD